MSNVEIETKVALDEKKRAMTTADLLGLLNNDAANGNAKSSTQSPADSGIRLILETKATEEQVAQILARTLAGSKDFKIFKAQLARKDITDQMKAIILHEQKNAGNKAQTLAESNDFQMAKMRLAVQEKILEIKSMQQKQGRYNSAAVSD